ncbi:MAG: hypothetical protein Ct9H90mP24_5920 [Methanobacteriota archaeon]|nr:MAG: hypothetical protein Ct9H90mP24_5920 [Euryarchaeota archaeon]
MSQLLDVIGTAMESQIGWRARYTALIGKRQTRTGTGSMRMGNRERTGSIGYGEPCITMGEGLTEVECEDIPVATVTPRGKLGSRMRHSQIQTTVPG